MKHSRTRVSDHALIRYLERAGGFEIERLRAEIGHRIDAAAVAGASGVIIDGYQFRIKADQFGPVVTTVLPASWLIRNHQRIDAEEGSDAG